MADHHYLPSLKKTTNLIQPPVAGSWVTVSEREIGALSQGLEVGEEARSRGATSVPDVWARPLLFHSAIRPKSEHPLHDEIVEEWRGLLSLIALSQWYEMRLEFEPVPIDERGLRFARALLALEPKPVQLEKGKEYSWLDALLVRVDGITVGALSPLTLVYTGVRPLPSSLRLVENGRLRPPSDPTDQRYLAMWVEKLHERLRPLLWSGDGQSSENKQHHRVVDDINTLLGDWLLSLRRGLGKSASEPLEEPGEEFAIADPLVDTTWSKLHTYNVYREVLRPAQIARTGAKSDLLLSRNRAGDEVVVITSQLLARDVKIWGSLRSKDIPGALEDPEAAIGQYFSTDSGDRIGTQSVHWIRPEKYFLTDTLLMSPGDTPLIADNEVICGQTDRRFVLPFRREILKFFAPADIESRLNPRFEAVDGGVRFVFTLPLDSTAVSKVDVRKEYRYKEPRAGQGLVRRYDPLPVYVFPRYRTSQWRRYFVFCAGRSATIDPMIEPNTQATIIRRKRPDGSVYQLSGESAFPEALAVNAEDGKHCGVVLLKKAPEPTGLVAGDHEMIIGVDFGTSNTNVFILPPQSDIPQVWAIDLARHLQPIFESIGEPQMTDAGFLPLSRVDLPIATTLLIHDATTVDHVLLDYFIYFSNEYRLPETVHADIKWQDIGKAQQFIRSILLLLLTEVVEQSAKSFRVIFSYPKAFSIDQRTQLESVWRSTLEELTTGPDRVLNVASDGSDPDRLKPIFIGVDCEVEAVAAGEFFASRSTKAVTIPHDIDRAKIATTAICIDVGGGTSDICIWYRGRRVLDASILLAGRQVGSWIRANSTLRELLFGRDAVLALKEVELKPTLFSGRLNQILRDQKQAKVVADNLVMHGTHPEIKRLRRLLALEFGAIAYYSATLLIAANRRGDVGGRIANLVADHGIHLHWGGNAAKMLQWLDYGKYSETGVAADILRAVFRNALGDAEMRSAAQKVGNKQSPLHKSEVAAGLIAWNDVREVHTDDKSANGGDGEIDPDHVPAGGGGGTQEFDGGYGASLILGDSVEIEGGRVSFDEPVASTRLFPTKGDTVVTGFPMDRLARFLEIVNYVGVSKGLIDEGKQFRLDDRIRAHIASQLLGEFVTMARLEPGKRQLEPVFIAEVKTLLGVLSQDQ